MRETFFTPSMVCFALTSTLIIGTIAFFIINNQINNDNDLTSTKSPQILNHKFLIYDPSNKSCDRSITNKKLHECFNGGTCFSYDLPFNSTHQKRIYECFCKEGYTGPNCIIDNTIFENDNLLKRLIRLANSNRSSIHLR
ncbi:unnamed protein product [Brachionus calyciflorus]|uniref:EGF-like domain-containing protein n=1 Tax=Brachionus calyciflorus TaxID=104777 RepID=A0A813M620_9BILA|nr:unnamed protein product [Brachionus calyciflorus]